MKYLDTTADTFPVGLFDTPFWQVYEAIRSVAASVWAVDPVVWRAGAAWGWYALNAPSVLENFRDVVTSALISSFAPMVKDWQTNAELVEYLRQWRVYRPTFDALQNLYKLFGVSADIQPISDSESQSVIPVTDTRLAFYIKVIGIDFERPLGLSDIKEIAIRATPMGSRPYPYYSIETHIDIQTPPVTCEILLRVGNDTIASQPASIFNVIDTVTGEDTQLSNPPSIKLIDKGGTMFTSNRTLVNIEPNNNYPLVDKGGTMFTSNKQLETIPVEGVEVIDLS